MINYIKGDLFRHLPFDPSKVSILLHACNCKGSWGAGVAAIFQRKYPSTYQKHKQFCSQHQDNSSSLLGTCQLIQSTQTDPGHQEVGSTLVGCLFTSDFFGTKKLSPGDIVKYTDLAMADLAKQLYNHRDLDTKDNRVVINMPKINAGLFGVPWEMTEEVLQKYTQFEINVYVV